MKPTMNCIKNISTSFLSTNFTHAFTDVFSLKMFVFLYINLYYKTKNMSVGNDDVIAKVETALVKNFVLSQI